MEKIFYIFKDSLDPKVVGSSYPQAYSFTKEYNPEAPNALFSLYKYTETFPEYIPDLDGIRLSGWAKKTDFVSDGFGGFCMMSLKAKSIIEKYNLCPHRFYDMFLYIRKVKTPYILMDIKSNYADFINFEKSKFVISCFEPEGIPVLIGSMEELIKKDKEVEAEFGLSYSVWANTMVVNKEFVDMDLDFFKIGKVDANLYVSERLRDEILANNLTGAEFIPATNLVME